MTMLRVEELLIPAGPGAPGWGDFERTVAVRNAVTAAATGTEALAVRPVEVLPAFQNPVYNPRHLFAARLGDEIVGRGFIAWYTEPGTRSALVYGEVHPAYRGHGIGTELLRELEAAAGAAGWSIFKAFPVHSSTPGGERLTAGTGYGDLPMADAGVRFLSRHGYRLQQVSRMSALALPVEPARLATMRAEAEREAGDAYVTVQWVGPTPDDLLDDVAFLRNRMSVDIPRGGMDSVEERWTPERIRDRDQRATAADRLLLTVAVRHVSTGRLVGFSVLAIPRDEAAPVMQEDTLVIREHRGARLGMLMKVANIQELARVAPGRRMVITGNAAENRYMLAVNEAVGFRPIALEGSWQKTLTVLPAAAGENTAVVAATA